MLEHYFALLSRLNIERDRLQRAASNNEIALRKVWVNQAEKELEGEIIFLRSKGVDIKDFDCDLSDDDLLRELTS